LEKSISSFGSPSLSSSRALQDLADFRFLQSGLAVSSSVPGLSTLTPSIGKLLQRGVALQLLLDHRAQIKRRHLQDLQRLPQLGREDQ
jgi:hypothetical protein